MSTQPFSSLYDQIRLHCKLVSVPAMDLAIRRSARELCRRSTVWRDTISIDVQAGLPEYSLVDTNTDADVLDIENAQYNPGSGIDPIPLTACSPEQISDAAFACPYPSNFFLDPPSRIVIGPAAAVTSDVAAGLWVRCILQPTLTATTLDDSLLQRADQAVVDGALYWLFSMGSEPWSSAPMAAHFKKEYERGISRAKGAVETGFQRTNILVAVHRF